MTAPSITQLPPGILRALRKATEIGIKFNKRDIVLIPHTKVKKTGGGVDWVIGTARASQQFTIEPVGSTLAGITGTTGGISSIEGATGHEWSYTLTAKYDAVIELFDEWQDGDTTYRVIAIQPFNGYEKTAVVTAYGKDPNYGV